MRISPSRQEGPPPPPTPPPLVDCAVPQPRVCPGISICPRCRTRTRREGVCVSSAEVFFLVCPILRVVGRHEWCMRYQTCTCDHYLGNAIHDTNHVLSCIIPSSRCATFYNKRLLQGVDNLSMTCTVSHRPPPPSTSTRFLGKLHVLDGRAAVGNLNQPVVPYHPSTEFSSPHRSATLTCMSRITHALHQ
jgi:hypothetical protein